MVSPAVWLVGPPRQRYRCTHSSGCLDTFPNFLSSDCYLIRTAPGLIATRWLRSHVSGLLAQCWEPVITKDPSWLISTARGGIPLKRGYDPTPRASRLCWQSAMSKDPSCVISTARGSVPLKAAMISRFGPVFSATYRAARGGTIMTPFFLHSEELQRPRHR